MAHRNQKGQLVIEAILVILFLVTVFLLLASHMNFTKRSFEKKDLTQESVYGNEKFYRKK